MPDPSPSGASPGKTAGAPVLYPFLFSLYPVLFLYARNVREAAWEQVLAAGTVSLAIAAALWLLSGLVVAGRGKRALLLFVFLLFFHSYGILFDLFKGLLPEGLGLVPSHLLVFILPGGIWLVLLVRIARSRRGVEAAGRLLRVAVLFLLIWTAVRILYIRLQPYPDPGLAGQQEGSGIRVPRAALPDIYCIIPDEYPSPETLRDRLGHDPAGFVASLRRRGFFVAEKSRSRFAWTEFAIADLLNFGQFKQGDDPFLAVRRSAVVSALDRLGYRIVDFASIRQLVLPGTDRRFFYDMVHASVFFDDFYRALFERSLLRILPDLWKDRATDLIPYYRQRVLQVFAELPGVIGEKGPKFVFVHLFSPHEPFVFDRRGGPVGPDRIWERSDPRYYLEQCAYVQNRILETVDRILANSAVPPVILLQSDHGYRGSRRPDRNRIPYGEWFSVFNALYLPGISTHAIGRNLSPANNFRLVFTHALGTEYPLLPDP
ncbi:MAG TPA: hypothetical protein PK919_05100 [Candidatus Aminicenantes bacterium]|nr:hypothetical protein [Candidatus Aminicenantes bacterium]